MADNYNGTCAMCKHFNLYDHYRFGSDKYRCSRLDQYLPWGERQCNKFTPAAESNAQREEMIEKARRGKL